MCDHYTLLRLRADFPARFRRIGPLLNIHLVAGTSPPSRNHKSVDVSEILKILPVINLHEPNTDYLRLKQIKFHEPKTRMNRLITGLSFTWNCQLIFCCQTTLSHLSYCIRQLISIFRVKFYTP